MRIPLPLGLGKWPPYTGFELHIRILWVHIQVLKVHIQVLGVHIRVSEVHIRFLEVHIQVLEVQIWVFEDQKYVYDLENDSQRSKISFDHLNLDVWRSRKPISTSKVAEI